MLAHGLEHVLDGDVLSVEATGEDRTAVNEDGRGVEADHGHHHARQGFVATCKIDKRIIAVAAHRELHRVSNGFAGGQ